MGIERVQGKPELPVDLPSNQRAGADKLSPAGRIADQDDVRLSAPTQEFMRVRKLVDEAPDIRKDRVKVLQNEVRNGTYSVAASDIADALVREHLFDG